MTYAPLKFAIATSTSLEGYAFTRKKKTTIFDIDIGVKVTQNVGLYFLHYVTYAHAKFEVVASKFRRRCIYKKHIFDIDPNLKVK